MLYPKVSSGEEIIREMIFASVPNLPTNHLKLTFQVKYILALSQEPSSVLLKKVIKVVSINDFFPEVLLWSCPEGTILEHLAAPTDVKNRPTHKLKGQYSSYVEDFFLLKYDVFFFRGTINTHIKEKKLKIRSPR